MSNEFLTNSGGIKTTLHHDIDGKLIVKNSADLTETFKRNTAFRNDDLGKGKNMRYVANIPLHVLHELQDKWEREGTDPKKGLKAFLNDPDMRAFRTSNDKV